MANPSRQGGNGFPHAQSGPGGSGYAPHQHQNQPPNFVTQASSSSAEGGYHHLPQTPRSATADYNSAYYHTPTSGGMASGVPSSYGPPGYGPPGAGAGGNEDDDNDEAHPHANAAALGNYNAAAIMYNVAQTGAAAPESLYGGQPQFGAGPSRHHAASTMQMIPEVAYMDVSGNHPPASSAGHGIYHQNPSLGGYTEAVATMPHAGAAVTDEADYSASGGAGGDSGDLENNWYGYQQQLVTVYDDITEGSLEDASETLLGISEWLLPHVADLGRFTATQESTSASTHGLRLTHVWQVSRQMIRASIKNASSFGTTSTTPGWPWANASSS